MTWYEILDFGKNQLQGVIAEADLDAWLLMEHVYGIDRSYYYLHMHQEVCLNDDSGEERFTRYRELVEQRRAHIPLQHLTGVQEFMGFNFEVNEHVLIPRQDTEVLVEEAGRYVHAGMHILDMCTGSGCVLISLLKLNRDVTGVGVDISERALEVAERNKIRHNVDADLVESDLFAEIDEKFDMIIANPPYIATGEIAGLMEEVRAHEPLSALDGTSDGLYFYKKITKQAPLYLKKEGWLLFEIGYDQGKEVSDMLTAQGFGDVQVVQDLAGMDRVVKGCLLAET